MGLSIWGAHRAADLQVFQFGMRRTTLDWFGETTTVGAYALHLQCAWRIRRDDYVLVGSGDLYLPSSTLAEDWDEFGWDREGENRRDELIKSFLGDSSEEERVVTDIKADNVGGFSIRFESGMLLEAFPDSTGGDELWRLLQPGTQTRHFVVTTSGIEE